MSNGEGLASTISSFAGDAAVIADLAERAAARDVVELVEGRAVGVVLNAGQSLQRIGLDEYGETPARKTGTVKLADSASFSGYVNRHAYIDGTTLWADLDAGTVTAVLDDHERDIPDGDTARSGDPGWGQHRAILTLPSTPDWVHWITQDGQLLSQSEFAEHIEFGANAIRDPDPATMLEIAQTFHAHTGVQFKSSNRLQSGETKLQYEETTNATAGRTGSIEIPDAITVGLQPFENGPTYEVLARFRYRIGNGQLKLGYRLIRPDLARRTAFTDITIEIAEATGLDVLAGRPRQ